jgi:hypothetical protein
MATYTVADGGFAAVRVSDARTGRDAQLSPVAGQLVGPCGQDRDGGDGSDAGGMGQSPFRPRLVIPAVSRDLTRCMPGVGRRSGRGRGPVGTAGRFGWSAVRGSRVGARDDEAWRYPRSSSRRKPGSRPGVRAWCRVMARAWTRACWDGWSGRPRLSGSRVGARDDDPDVSSRRTPGSLHPSDYSVQLLDLHCSAVGGSRVGAWDDDAEVSSRRTPGSLHPFRTLLSCSICAARLSGVLGRGRDDDPEVSSRRTPGSVHLSDYSVQLLDLHCSAVGGSRVGARDDDARSGTERYRPRSVHASSSRRKPGSHAGARAWCRAMTRAWARACWDGWPLRPGGCPGVPGRGPGRRGGGPYPGSSSRRKPGSRPGVRVSVGW